MFPSVTCWAVSGSLLPLALSATSPSARCACELEAGRSGRDAVVTLTAPSAHGRCYIRHVSLAKRRCGELRVGRCMWWLARGSEITGTPLAVVAAVLSTGLLVPLVGRIVTLDLSASEVPTLGWLRGADRLERLTISFADLTLADLTVLGDLPRLSSLIFVSCTLASLAPIAACKNLWTLSFTSCHGAADYASLAVLDSLGCLEIHNCRVDDFRWVAAKRLRSLTLVVRHSEENEWPRLGDLSTVTNLCLASLPRDTLSSLRSCTSLLSLALSQCPQCRDFSAVGSLCFLRELALAGAGITDLAWLVDSAAAVSLEKVCLDALPQLHDLSPLATVPHLCSLSVEDVNCNGLSWLSMCTDLLQELHLTSVGEVAERELHYVGTLSTIKVLELCDVATSDIAWLSGCTHLTHLQLLLCVAVTDLRPISALHKLSTLSISDSEASGFSSFESLVNLREFKLDAGAMASVAWMRHCKALRQVSVYNTRVTDGLASLATLPHLQSLALCGCGLESLDFLAGCSRTLTTLMISNNPELSNSSTILASLESLETLVYYDMASGEDVFWIGKSRSLKRLYVRTPEVVQKLTAMGRESLC